MVNSKGRDISANGYLWRSEAKEQENGWRLHKKENNYVVDRGGPKLIIKMEVPGNKKMGLKPETINSLWTNE